MTLKVFQSTSGLSHRQSITKSTEGTSQSLLEKYLDAFGLIRRMSIIFSVGFLFIINYIKINRVKELETFFSRISIRNGENFSIFPDQKGNKNVDRGEEGGD